MLIRSFNFSKGAIYVVIKAINTHKDLISVVLDLLIMSHVS